MAAEKYYAVESLIEAVRKRPCLYDTMIPDYKNAHTKKMVWQEIAKEVGGKNGPTMCWKWKNLRDSYAKHKKHLILPDNDTAQKFINWRWAPHMTFLDPFLRKPKEYIAFDDTVEQNSAEPSSSYSGITVDVNPDMESSRSGFYSTSRISKEERKRKYEIEEVYEQPSDKLDKIDYLFLSYADTFKRLSPRRQTMLKLEMAKLFAEAELNEINSDPIKFEN